MATNNTITAFFLLLLLLLAGCGSSSSNNKTINETAQAPPPWTGGLVRIWEPENSPRGAMILHHGHSNFFGNPPFPTDWDLAPVAEAFAAAGLVVYGMEMPPPAPGTLLHDHGPLEKFTDPVISLIDAIEPTGLPIYMAGVSGGAWTTVVLTSLDQRITRGYAVEGGFPCRSANCDPGDWEQRQTDYDQAYAAASGRLTAIAIPGSASDCATLMLPIPCVNDMTTDKHVISSWAVAWIIDDISTRLAP